MPLVAEHLYKSFGATQALSDVSIRLHSGKVHALVGENGAGKSTLFKACAGAHRPDKGSMTFDEQPFAPRNLREAQARGVALVFQEITINFALGIAENIFIDRMSQFSGFMGISGWKNLRAEAQRILDEIGAQISVKDHLDQLDLGQLKILEVARALSYRPRVLLLDESTAFLSTVEIDALFRVIETLKGQDIAIGYISHHLEELEKIADEITILKDGGWVGTYPVGEISEDEIKALMVGRDLGHNLYPPSRPTQHKDTVLKLVNVRASGLEPMTLDLRQGEILGIGGLKGAGGETLLSLINGDVHLQGGSMQIEDRPYRPINPSHAWQHGIAYLPGDRTGEGLILDFTVQDNLVMASIPQRRLLVDRGVEKKMVEALISALQIKTPSPRAICSSLSGGNLQKVVMGKCMAAQPKVLLLNNPTRGIDVGARAQIYQIIREQVAQGLCAVLLSEDLPELLGMSDRLVVMRKGCISQIFDREHKPSEEDVITYMI
ncbi:MAG: sugar ABC transporter ATP-binding protein [Chloroflexi bacterium]|nr:sugar ABC transporter ATP-binding protein [Chloroflexota bacterium]